MSDTPKNITGAVTFLDVLGWKGMWLQHANPISPLSSIVQETRKKAKEISDLYAKHQEFRGIQEITRVISISDTIAIFSEGNTALAIELQAKICSWLLEEALSQRIPLRGAISYGSYSVQDNLMQGHAVDEAASWYEFVDWIGVVLTPSAHLKIKPKTEPKIQSVTEYDNIPFKKIVPNLNTCVDWDFNTKKGNLEEIIVKMGVLTPEIASKYLNTLAFLNRKIHRANGEDFKN